MPKFSKEWRGAIIARSQVSMPEKISKRSTLIAVARAWFDYGDDNGRDIRVGGDSVAVDTDLSSATVRRVRRWLIEEGFGHHESGSVMGKKAEWWHAAIPDRSCSTCSARGPSEGSVATVRLAIPLEDRFSSSGVPTDPVERLASDPTSGPTTDPAGGIATRNPEVQPSTEQKLMEVSDFERVEQPPAQPPSDVPCAYEHCTMNLSSEYLAAGKVIHDRCALERDRRSGLERSA